VLEKHKGKKDGSWVDKRSASFKMAQKRGVQPLGKDFDRAGLRRGGKKGKACMTHKQKERARVQTIQGSRFKEGRKEEEGEGEKRFDST